MPEKSVEQSRLPRVGFSAQQNPKALSYNNSILVSTEQSFDAPQSIACSIYEISQTRSTNSLVGEIYGGFQLGKNLPQRFSYIINRPAEPARKLLPCNLNSALISCINQICNSFSLKKIHSPVYECTLCEFSRLGRSESKIQKASEDFLRNKRAAVKLKFHDIFPRVTQRRLHIDCKSPIQRYSGLRIDD